MPVRATFSFDAPAAARVSHDAMRRFAEWGAVAGEAAVKTAIVSWPSGAIVDTGAMLNSVKGEMTGPYEATISVGVDYAMYVEFGTFKMPARPFFQVGIARLAQMAGAFR